VAEQEKVRKKYREEFTLKTNITRQMNEKTGNVHIGTLRICEVKSNAVRFGI